MRILFLKPETLLQLVLSLVLVLDSIVEAKKKVYLQIPGNKSKQVHHHHHYMLMDPIHGASDHPLTSQSRNYNYMVPATHQHRVRAIPLSHNPQTHDFNEMKMVFIPQGLRMDHLDQPSQFGGNNFQSEEMDPVMLPPPPPRHHHRFRAVPIVNMDHFHGDSGEHNTPFKKPFVWNDFIPNNERFGNVRHIYTSEVQSDDF